MADVGARSSGKKRGGLVLFLVGILLGILGAVFAPRYLGDYLPGGIGGTDANVTGVVTRKLAEDARLLLTVVTDSGAVLATFERRTTEIDLLVEEGDSVTFELSAYAPFVENPRLGRVAKPTAGDPGAERGAAALPTDEDADRTDTPAPIEAPADSVGPEGAAGDESGDDGGDAEGASGTEP